MKIKTLVTALVINCISSLSINTAINQSTVAQTSDQIRKMRAVGVPVVLPSYLPPGFRLTNFVANPFRKPRNALEAGRNSYSATYQGPNNCQISISGADGGWGANGPVRQWEVNTPLFGKIILEEEDGSVYIPPEPNSLSAGAGAVVSDERLLPGFAYAGYIFSFRCKNSLFSPQQASRILQSMQIVK